MVLSQTPLGRYIHAVGSDRPNARRAGIPTRLVIVAAYVICALLAAIAGLLLAARLGATLLLERSFTFPAKTLARLRDEEATVFPAVPTVFATTVAMSKNTTYPSVRCLTNAAAGLPPALHEGLRRVFPNAALHRMYGQTECIRVCYLEPELVDRKPTSVGKAIPGTICNPDSKS